MFKRNVDNISIQGYSHLLTNKECQDSSIAWKEKKYSCVIISDGHGGEKYFRSSKGAHIACDVGKDVVSSFMEAIKANNRLHRIFLLNRTKREEMLSQLERSIIQRWNEAIKADCLASSFESDERFIALSDINKNSILKTPAKAYGATFIAAVVTENYCFIIKLGDGNICLLKNSGPELFYGINGELRDNQLQFNLTTSLCDSGADKEIKHCFFATNSNGSTVEGLILTTDGIINSYTSEQAYLNLIGNIFKGYKEDPLVLAREELSNFLPHLSEKGSGDDLTIGIIF